MKFKLPRPILTPEVRAIVAREARKQKVELVRASKREIKEIRAIARAIVKKGLPPHLVRKKLPGKLGHGIFLRPDADPILKGQIIGLYAGNVEFVPQNIVDDCLYAFESLSYILFSRQEQKHFAPKARYHPRRQYSLHVDALKSGNFTRFINHSDKPNLVADLYKIPANTLGVAASPLEIVYLADKTILPGEQLLVSYDGDDKSYWGAAGIRPVPITPKTFRLDKSLKVVGRI